MFTDNFKRFNRFTLLAACLVVVAAMLHPAPKCAAEEVALGTAIDSSQLDANAFAQWFDDRETPIAQDQAKDGPREVIWTRDKSIEWHGLEFGREREPGVRQLRVGFKEPIPMGAILVRGGTTVSVLKPDAAYPGDLGDDKQWLAAERLSSKAAAAREDYVLWTLPPETRSRAIRFTHTADPTDQNPAGWLGGALVFRERVTNVAPLATVRTAVRSESANLLNDESNNRTWEAWDNGSEGGVETVTSDRPVFATFAWQKLVRLNGVCLLWSGMSATQVEVLDEATQGSPFDARESSWKSIAASDTVSPQYPLALGPNWLPFGRTVETRAIRLRITAPMKLPPPHPHLQSNSREGRRVWLGELLAIAPLGDAPLSDLRPSEPQSETPPPIAVKFHLNEPGEVTLVIEDEQGHRVRNLLSETPFPAGDNIAWWDGSDDLLRDPDAARHGLYHIPTRLVAPGKYVVRGLVRPPLKLTYQQSVYNAGKPAWDTADKTGGWMTNHTPPTSIACVPDDSTKDGKPLVFMGAFVAEGGHGLQWVREDGTKIGGQGWVGGNWTGAPTLAFDAGKSAIPTDLIYAASVWEGELRITAKTQDLQDRPVVKLQLGSDPSPQQLPPSTEKPEALEGFDGGDRRYVLAGIAARDGVVVCSMRRQNELIFFDAKDGKELRRVKIDSPRGIAFDNERQLLVLSGKTLRRFGSDFSTSEEIAVTGLEDPRQIAIDPQGNLYISDRGKSHQVKVFSATGKPLTSIGKPGIPTVGAYDPGHMNNPNGLGIDSQGNLWVAENDFHPKRVSKWSPDGKLLQAFYGPGEYGGGGVLDSNDKSRFFYKGQEFLLDWKQGTDKLLRVFFRPTPLFDGPYGPYSPDTPLYPKSRPGERYFTSCFTHNPTNGDHISFIWKDDGKIAQLVAALGNAHDWGVLKSEPFKSRWPAEINLAEDQHRNPAAFSWSDLNGDGLPQPEEVTIVKESCYGVTTNPDLSMVVARFGGKAVRFMPVRFNEHGAPIYQLDQPTVLAAGSQSPTSSGGDQALTDAEGWTIHTIAPEPFSPMSLGGSFRGEPRWSYPNPWPGLHASHEAAVPDRPGMVIGTTRLLGNLIHPPGEIGPVFGINANMGNMYLLTADGLFVATLFHDIRQRPNWAMPTARRGMDVSNVSLHDENFWPSLTQTADGNVYVVDGGRVSLVRVEGLDSVRRIAPQTLVVSTDDLAKASEWYRQAELRRQAEQGSNSLAVALSATAPNVDGKLADWPVSTEWAAIDRRGTRANFDSQTKPYNASGAAAISADRLFLAWKTNEKDLPINSGESANAFFKTGGGLDLMLGTDASADSQRKDPAPGDLRLLVGLVAGKPQAILYRARVPGTKEPIAFSSPWRTIKLDSVEDVSADVQCAADGEGNYEVSIPLATLGWIPEPGKSYKADLGLLRGDGRSTTQRVYWSNKATAITSDVPSEAELTPQLWGEWNVIAR